MAYELPWKSPLSSNFIKHDPGADDNSVQSGIFSLEIRKKYIFSINFQQIHKHYLVFILPHDEAFAQTKCIGRWSSLSGLLQFCTQSLS